MQQFFNAQLDWENIYLSTPNITNNSYLLQTNFKQTHNILSTNEKLFVWKLLERPHCICGIVDTNIHYLIQCKLIKPFWDKIFVFMKATLDVSFPISESEIFFGLLNPLDDTVLNSINYILLIAKTFIWKEKRLGKPCTMHDFLIYLREQLLIETSSKLFKTKQFHIQLLEQI